MGNTDSSVVTNVPLWWALRRGRLCIWGQRSMGILCNFTQFGCEPKIALKKGIFGLLLRNICSQVYMSLSLFFMHIQKINVCIFYKKKNTHNITSFQLERPLSNKEKNVEKLDLYARLEEMLMVQSERQQEDFSKNLKTELSYDAAIPLLGI